MFISIFLNLIIFVTLQIEELRKEKEAQLERVRKMRENADKLLQDCEQSLSSIASKEKSLNDKERKHANDNTDFY